MDNNTAKAFLSSQGGTVSIFLSRLACHVLNLADTLIPAYIPTYLSVEADIYYGEGWFQNSIFLA